MLRRFTPGLVLALAVASGGCGDNDADHFLEAMKRGDYDAAFAELHTEARAQTPSPAALKATMTAAGITIERWSWTCGSRNLSTKRIGYIDTTVRKGDGKHPTVLIGVPPAREKCTPSLTIDMKKDDALPGSPWKVRGVKVDSLG